MMRGVFKICDEPRSTHEGACLRIYDEPESPNRGKGVCVCLCVCVRYMKNRNRHMRSAFKIYDDRGNAIGGGVLTTYDEPESPHEKACLRCMMKPDRQMTGHA